MILRDARTREHAPHSSLRHLSKNFPVSGNMASEFESDAGGHLHGKPRLGGVSEAVRRAKYVAETLWLFSFTDLKTIVIPSTLFGLIGALAADRLAVHQAPSDNDTVARTLTRMPLVLFWVSVNYIPFAINNQLGPESLAEDAINKPWRPLPSKRLTIEQAKLLMVLLYVSALLFSMLVSGGMVQAIGLLGLGIWYNNLGGADGHPLVRNAINALGYTCFTSGAMEVAIGSSLPLSGAVVAWFGMLGAIIATTVHGQDLYDQEGDAARGRRTLPLVFGDGLARWILGVFMLIWGVVCPGFWNSPLIVRALSLGLALAVAVRTLAFRSVASDRATFVVWNVWICSVYALPLTGR